MSNPWEKYKESGEGSTTAPWSKYSSPAPAQPVSDEPVQQPPPQLTTPQESVAVPQTRDLWPKLKDAGRVFLRESADVAKGVVEGPATVISGAASFIPAMLSQAPTVLGGVLAGEPVKGLAAAKEGMDKFMEAFTVKPESKFGQTVAEVAASPFTVAHEGIDAGVRALGGGDEQVKAAQFVFDSALVALPHIAKKIKNREKLTPKEIEEVKVKAPEVQPDLLTDVLNKTNKLKVEPPPVEAAVAKFPANQSIVDGIATEVAKRTGKRRDAYQHAMSVVRDFDGDVSQLDMKKISKKEGKTVALIKRLVEERDAKKTSVPTVRLYHGGGKEVPDGSPRWVSDNKEYAQQYADKAGGKVYYVDVPADHPGLSKAFDDTGTSFKAPYNNFELGGEHAKNFKEVETPVVPTPSLLPAEPVEVGLRPEIPKVPEMAKVGEEVALPTREEIAQKYARTTPPETVTPTPLPTVETPIQQVNFTRENDLRNIRAELRQKLEEKKKREKEAEGAKVPEAPEVKTRTAADLAAMYKVWKGKKVEKMNQPKPVDATFNNSIQESKPQVKESDLAFVDEKFATFKSYDELVEYATETGTLGKPVQDPITGRWFIEPTFKELDDYAWDTSEPDFREIKRGRRAEEDFSEGPSDWELSDTGTRKLWDIFNNERGSVELPSKEEIKNVFKTSSEVFSDKFKGIFIDRSKGDNTITHPATFTGKFFPVFAKIAEKYNAKTILDPFGGVGTIGKIKDEGFKGKVIANELEPEWSALHESHGVDVSLTGDARKMDSIPDGGVDMIITSPTYGNALAYPRLKGKITDLTYANSIGREMTPGNSGRMAWGEKYRDLHREAYKEFHRVIKDNGIAVINMKDFINKGKIVPVTDFHIKAMEDAGFKLLDHEKVPVHGLPEGKIKRATVTHEDILVFEKPNKRGVFSFLNNERGSVDVTDLKIAADKLQRLQRKAEKLGKTVEEVLDMIGLSPDQAKEVMAKMAQLPQMQEEIKKSDPVLWEIFNPDPKTVVGQKTKTYRDGTEVTFPAVTADAFKKVWGGQKQVLPTSWTGKYLDYTTIRMNKAEQLGVKDLLYDKWEAKKGDARREFIEVKAEIKKLTKEMTKEDRRKLSIVAYARQPNGVKMLANDGITEIPVLSPKGEAMYELMRGKYDTVIDRLNYNRVRTGQKPIPYRDNYFPMIHQANALNKLGIGEGLSFTPLTKIQASSSKFNGTYFPFAKPRKITDIPLELDIFDAYEKYMSYALDELHTAPVAALAKELADIKLGKGKKAVGLAQHNPGMYKFLVEWSDEILGIDRLTQATNAKFPGAMRIYNNLMHNIVAATLFGNVGTFMKQPLALRGVWADTTTYDTLAGILRTTSERTFLDKGRSSKSNVLAIRTMELAFDDMAKNLAKHGLRGLRDNVAMVTAWPMQIMDGLTAESGWNAGYSYAKRKLKYDDAKAFRFAEDLVTRTQGVGVRGAVAPIQATALFKWATMFQTFAINDFNYLARDVIGINNPNPKNWKHVSRVLKYVAAGALVNQLAEMAGIPTPFPAPFQTFKENTDEGMGTGDATIQSLKEFLEVLPIAGGSIKYQSSLFGPMGELAKDLPDAVGGANYSLGWTLEALGLQVQSLDWYNMTERQKLNTKLATAKVLGTVLGIPMTNQLMKSIRTSSNGGDWYEVLLGIYKEYGKASPPRPPSFEGRFGGGLEERKF